MTAEMLTSQFKFSERVLRDNTVDLTHSETCLQPSSGGNCVNWIVGHILTNRNTVLQLLGEKPIWSKEKAAPYGRGSDPVRDPDSAVSFDQMLKDHATSQRRIVAALQRLGSPGLAKPAPSEMTGGKEASIGTMLAGFLFHEAYHVGQTGIVRRLIGKEGAIR